MPGFRENIEVIKFVGFLDWFIFFLILGATLGIIVYGHWRKKKEPESTGVLELLLMGRQLTLPMFVATLVATWYGGIFGVTQISFEKGVYNFLTQGVFWYITYLIFAFFLVDRIRSYEALTLPDLADRMFGPRSRYVAGVFNFLNVVPVAYAISLGLFLKILFGGNLEWNIAIGVLFVAGYSSIGGFRSVVFSDILQFGVMCLSVLLVVVFSIYEVGGISFLRSNLPETHFSPLGGETLATTLVWGLIALSTLVDPNFYQRCFAAKNGIVAKRGILLSTLVWFLFDICTTLGGLYARATLPEADSGTAYLSYSMQVLPPGFRGFFLAGILATILSTMDSYIFIAGTSLSYDLVPRRMRGKTWITRLGILLVGLLAIALSSHFEGNIRIVWKTLGSYSAACLLFPMLIGYVLPGRIKDLEFVSVCILGSIAVTAWRLWDREGFWINVDEIYIGSLVTGLGLFFVLLSRKMFQREPGGGDLFVKKP